MMSYITPKVLRNLVDEKDCRLFCCVGVHDFESIIFIKVYIFTNFETV